MAAGAQPTILARRVGLSAPTVTNIERGRVPGVDVLERLARGLNVSPCLLAYGVEAPAAEVEDGAPLRCATIGERLAAAREHAGLSMRALGRAADLTPTTIGNIEAGKVLPGVDVAEALAGALKISPCYLAFAEGTADGPRFPPPVRRPKKPTAPRTRARKATPRPARTAAGRSARKATSSSSRKPAPRSRSK